MGTKAACLILILLCSSPSQWQSKKDGNTTYLTWISSCKAPIRGSKNVRDSVTCFYHCLASDVCIQRYLPCKCNKNSVMRVIWRPDHSLKVIILSQYLIHFRCTWFQQKKLTMVHMREKHRNHPSLPAKCPSIPKINLLKRKNLSLMLSTYTKYSKGLTNTVNLTWSILTIRIITLKTHWSKAKSSKSRNFKWYKKK